MRKKCLLIILIGLLLHAAVPSALIDIEGGIQVTRVEKGDQLLFTYELPIAGAVETGNAFTRITLANAPIYSVTGKPRLPYIPFRLALPENRVIKSVDITVHTEDTLKFRLPVEPGPLYGFLSDPKATEAEIELDDDIYSSGELWPLERYTFGGIQLKQGNPIVSCKLFPVQVSPLHNRAVAARSFTVCVELEEKKQKKERSGRAADSKLLKRRVLNPLEIMAENSISTAVSHSRGAADAQYLAITSDSLKNASGEFTLDTLLKLHESKGLSTKILTVESIDASYEGADLQEKIRNSIIDHYNNHGTIYVLLAGDTPIIPERMFFMDEAAKGFRKELPTDSYYSCLDGSHNSDGDQKWGESSDGIDGGFPDMLADVYVGRFTVENSEELSNMVRKTVKHLNGGTTSKVLLAGEHLGFGGISEYAKPSMEELWTGGEANGYHTRSFADEPELVKDTLYAEIFPKNKWYDSDIVKKINDNSVGIINHLGHGLERLNMRIYLETAVLDSILNEKPIFTFSQACLSGDFTKECIAEFLTSGTRYGMWGGIWNSNNGLGAYSSTDSPSQFTHRQFWHAYFGREINHVGGMSAFSDEAALELSMDNWAYRWVSLITNLYGDPAAEFQLRSASPTIRLDPIGEGNVWDMGHDFEISWYDNIESPVSIELMQNGELIQTIESSIPSSQKYKWRISEELAAGDNYRIRISCSELNIYSESEQFSIDTTSILELLTPVDGDTVYKEEIIEISWEDNLDETVSILLYSEKTLIDTIASALAPDVQSFNWSVPLDIQHNVTYSIHIVSDNKQWLKDLNSEYISIFSPSVREFPYVENFETYEKGLILGFWSQADSDDFNWKVNSGATPSRVKADDWWNLTGPAADASGTGKYIYCEATGNSGGKKAGLFSPPLDIEGLKNGKLSFKVHMYCKEDYGNMGSLKLHLLVDGEWFTPVNMSGSKGDKWVQKEVDLSKHSKAKELMAYFSVTTGKSFASDIAIDEFKVTGEKDATSLIKQEMRQRGKKCTTFPAVLTDETVEITVQLPSEKMINSASYKIFDVVGNVVDQGNMKSITAGSWVFKAPPYLGNGSYVLLVKANTDKIELFRTVIGKKYSF